MGKFVLDSQNWDRVKCTKPFLSIYIFIMISTVKMAVSQPAASINCSLDYFSSTPYSICEGGDWGGFLRDNYCGKVFCQYLYALGQRANQTGLIYLNLSEQNSCLASMKRDRGYVFSCGIEKLTSGAGGCSDYSVADVRTKLGDKLRSLSENCRFDSSGKEWNQSCSSCVRSWVEIRGMPSVSVDAESLKDENDICRFAVLVSLTSSWIEDKLSVLQVYKCLGEQKSFTEIQEPIDKRKKIREGMWILTGLIGVAAMVLIATCILLIRCYKSNPPPKNHAFRNVVLKDPGCPKFPIKEVYAATNNLNQLNFIGEGTAGKVYKGLLSNSRPVAVKHIINDVNVETFVREVTSLSHIKHGNLVALLGYCLREEECFLIYELCLNGNLSEWIFGKDKVLSWIQRLQIAIDSARGLWFLHSYSEGCIVHRDIKPTNILLGPNFEAKLSDFGLSKVIDLGETYVSSEVRGTFGYVDPEYQSNRRVNSSGDVYSFGIVLLQILSGKKVVNLNLRKPMPLNKMAKVLTRGGSITEFADPKLDGEYSAEAFDLTLQLALSCTSIKQQRPSMEQVLVKLENALDISTRAKASSPEVSPVQRSNP